MKRDNWITIIEILEANEFQEARSKPGLYWRKFEDKTEYVDMRDLIDENGLVKLSHKAEITIFSYLGDNGAENSRELKRILVMIKALKDENQTKLVV